MSDKPCRCGQVKMLHELEADMLSEGYREGFMDGKAEVLPILTDLIAELRDRATGYPNETTRRNIRGMADRAEARLREVTGDE